MNCTEELDDYMKRFHLANQTRIRFTGYTAFRSHEVIDIRIEIVFWEGCVTAPLEIDFLIGRAHSDYTRSVAAIAAYRLRRDLPTFYPELGLSVPLP